MNFKMIQKCSALVTGAFLVAMSGAVFADEESDLELVEELVVLEAELELELEVLAYEKLMEMANFLAGLESFSVHLRAGYDVMQENGQKIEFLENRRITLERPDKLVVKENSSSDRGHVLLFDGDTVTIADNETGVYAQAPQPGSIDDAIVYFLRDLQMRLPLAGMLTTRFPQELDNRLRVVEYDEESGAFSVPTHHIAARTRDNDIQVWISEGALPVPMRIVLTYIEYGEPQYWAEFSDWNLDPTIDKSTFAYEPPEGAEQIVLAVQIASAMDDVEIPGEGEQP